jgi:inositol phosphorylceramide synthase catalytic subunit
MTRQFLPLLSGSLIYFSWFGYFIGLKAEHFIMYGSILALYFSHSSTQRFVLGFAIFIAHWVIYSSLGVVPNYTVNPIHIVEPYNIEKALFGLNTEGGIITLNEYFKTLHIPVLDLLSGFFYINWVPVPLLFAIWLFINNKKIFLKFSYCFVFTNILGYIIYFMYPSAPPWYIEQYGFQLQPNIVGNAAGLIEVDKILGNHLFENLYKQNTSVFAAMPSLHSAYPLLCFLYGRQLKNRWFDVIFAIFSLGIWFAAVYTRHHYLIDVIAGIIVAIVGYNLFEYISEKTRAKNWLDSLKQKIEKPI